jgi:diguanylate cyclase (GGDEF)-like protein
MVVEANRYGRTLSVILFDIDDFKRLNDSYGHQFGDVVLVSIAQSVRDSLRDSDVPGRYGGEEFLIILPEEELEKAAYVAERICDGVKSLSWDNGCTVTISCGVSELKGDRPEELVRRADISMYEAKHLGKNRVCF